MSDRLHFLYTGVTFAYFMLDGNVPTSRDLLNTSYKFSMLMVLWLSLKRGCVCGHGLGGCDRLGGFGGFGADSADSAKEIHIQKR